MKKSLLPVLIIAFLLPAATFAKSDDTFDISAWVPYWRSDRGVDSIIPHMDSFTEVNPFVYTVKTNGILNQASPVRGDEWIKLREAAKKSGIKYIPTVMWSNGSAMDEVFRDPVKRQAHIRSISREVFRNSFDGIDIDYEAKYARTRPYFSEFLKELNSAIGYNKWIMCTIESRTPLDSRYSSPDKIPDDIEYANDFVEINKYCDRVRIMAYDQGRIDVKLDKEREHPYMPVADVEWVEKAVRLAMEDIDADKIVIGVATYGYEYDMFDSTRGDYVEYSRLWSFNPGYATDTAAKLGISPVRNSAGELMLTFPAKDSPDPTIPLPNATRVVTWSDAGAIEQKIELAKRLGVRGVAVFKIDGGQDPLLWDVLKKYKGNMIHREAIKEANASNAVALSQKTKSNYLPKIDLEYGDRKEEVKLLQKFLNATGYTVVASGLGSMGRETEYFGPATKNALIRYQKDNSINPTIGYYGPVTRAVMQSI